MDEVKIKAGQTWVMGGGTSICIAFVSNEVIWGEVKGVRLKVPEGLLQSQCRLLSNHENRSDEENGGW